MHDHVEMDLATRQSLDDEQTARLRLRVFPKGNTQSDEQITAETFLKYSLNLAAPHFLFDFRIILPIKPSPNPDQEI